MIKIMDERVKNVLEWIMCIVIALLLAILVRYFVGTPTVVQQYSMYPTLKENERLILNRISRTIKEMPKRGDIITFEEPSNTDMSKEEANLEKPIAEYKNEQKGIWKSFVYNVLEIKKRSYIKRVIGLPGEHVKLENGKVYINGEELKEDYLNANVTTNTKDEFGREFAFTDFIVPENCVFAMGDNRHKSTDCRAFGCIPLQKVESKVWIRFWPLNKFGKIDA